MNTDDPFYKYAPPPDITEPGVHFQYRSPENDWASDKAQANGSGGANGPRTFFVTAGSGSTVNISAGAINSVPCSTIVLPVTDGQEVYIKETVDGDGVTTAVVCEAGSSTPANTTTEGYQLLARVTVTSGVVTVEPLGWDYSRARVCGVPGTSTWHDFW